MFRTRIWLAALLLAALSLYLVGNGSVALLDRDEPRYAQASRQMLQSGDWVVPRLMDKIRAKKPPLIYWCQAGAMACLGDNAFAARLPSVIAIFLTACLMAAALYRLATPQHALWATLVFCSSALTIVAAKSCLTDAVSLLWTTIAQLCLYLMWRGRASWPVVTLFSASLALGLLTKGLIGGVVFATLLALLLLRFIDRRRIQPAPSTATPATRQSGWAVALAKVLLATAIVAAIVGPWLWLVSHRSDDFLMSLKNEAQGHVMQGMEGHGGPPGMHLLMIWGDFLPWSLFLPVAIVSGLANRRDPFISFSLAAVIGPWLFVEFAIRTKLPHYMLPTLPFLSFLTADCIVRSITGRRPHLASRDVIAAGKAWAIVMISVGLLPWLAAPKFRPLPWTSMVLLSLAAMVWAPLAVLLLRNWRVGKAMVTIGFGMMLSCAIFYGLYLPQARFLRLSVLAADVLKQHGATAPGSALMVDYKEPSLAFYQGGSIREAPHAAVVEAGDIAQWTPWMVITRDVWNHSPPDVRAKLQVVATFHGLSPSDGMRAVEVMVVRKR